MRFLCATMVLVLIVTPVLVWGQGAGDTTINGIPLTLIITHLEGEDPALRMAALVFLQGAGAEAAAAVPAVTGILSADDANLRARAANVLAGIGPAASSAAAKLQDLAANDPDPAVRGSAEMALMEVGAPAAPGGEEVGGDELYIEPVQQVPEPVMPTADPGVTPYLQPLRDHQAKLAAIQARVDALATAQPQENAAARKWAQDLQSAGNDLLAEGRAFKATLHAFVTSRTRHGLTEEIWLIQECVQVTESGGDGIRSRTGFDLGAYAMQRDLQQQRQAARDEVIKMLAEEVDGRIEAEGLVVLLATDGLAAVRREALSRVRAGAEAEIDRVTEQELGIAFHDAVSFRAAVKAKARGLLRSNVTKLLFRVTSNEIVVELLGAPIIAWIEGDLWPKLKEAFRNKGNLEFRTAQSARSLEAARMRLWALPPGATLDQVRATIRSAEGALKATRYLEGDLNRANRADLYAQLEAAANQLKRAFTITEQRFLLNKMQALAEVAPQEEVYRALLAMIEAMVREIEIPEEQAETVAADAGTPAEGTPNREVERIEFEPRYLVHIIETSTMYGPQERDSWILHPVPPDENGIVLTADGSGGVFINKTDRHLGPYTSNYQVAPVLVVMGVPGVWLGQRYIVADPAIWGGG